MIDEPLPFPFSNNFYFISRIEFTYFFATSFKFVRSYIYYMLVFMYVYM